MYQVFFAVLTYPSLYGRAGWAATTFPPLCDCESHSVILLSVLFRFMGILLIDIDLVALNLSFILISLELRY